MSENKGKVTNELGVLELKELVKSIEEEFGVMHTNPEHDEMGRIIITDLNQIPKAMTEEQETKFWQTHAMSDELLDETYIENDEDELPPPKRQSSD